MLAPGACVALTGASGFIGRRLAHKLLELKHPVRALVRDTQRAADLADAGCELIAGDLDNMQALTSLATGADHLVHCAGAVRGARYADFRRVNVAGVAHLVQALAALPAPPRLLLFSSLAAREPGLSWYARSKQEAEDVLAAAAPEQTPFAWTILRPPAVYGPGDRELLPVFQSMARGFAPLPGSRDARVSLIHIDDLVGATLACMHSDSAVGKTLTLHDGRAGGYSWQDIADIAARVWQRPVKLVPVPRWLLNSAAQGNLALARLMGRQPMLTPLKLCELRHPDWVVDNDAFGAVCNWQPQIGLEAGLMALRESMA